MAADEVKLLNRIDMIRALRNVYQQTLVENEINVLFFKWKEKHLTNGQSLKMVKDNLVNSERNVETMTQKLRIVDEMLYDNDHKNQKTSKPAK